MSPHFVQQHFHLVIILKFVVAKSLLSNAKDGNGPATNFPILSLSEPSDPAHLYPLKLSVAVCEVAIMKGCTEVLFGYICRGERRFFLLTLDLYMLRYLLQFLDFLISFRIDFLIYAGDFTHKDIFALSLSHYMQATPVTLFP